MPNIEGISRWPINKTSHSVFLRYVPIIFFYSEKYSRGMQRVDHFWELAPRLVRISTLL